MNIVSLKYRTYHNGIPPRRIKLQIPGWSGEPTYEAAMPWHCKPFMDGSCYGLELYYPWKTELIVTSQDGVPVFEGDFSDEKPTHLPDWEPVGNFAPGHFGMCSMVDIQPEPGMGMLVLPHPRYYTDHSGEVPLTVSGLLEMDWWPDIFFLVFKTPEPDRRYVFRQYDPIAAVIFVPKVVEYDLREMTDAEKAERIRLECKLDHDWPCYGTRTFFCKDGKFFDDKYKRLSQLAAKEGLDRVKEYIDNPTLLPYFNRDRTVIDMRTQCDEPNQESMVGDQGGNAGRDTQDNCGSSLHET